MTGSIGGITQSNAARLNVKNRFSSPFLRVDDRARIHLEIELTSADEANVRLISNIGGAEIKTVYKTINTLVAWVPYDRIDALADLDVVKSIGLPDYGLPDSNLE